MAESAPQFSPNDYPSISDEINKAHLQSIDETEEFHDPFSDLSLFLTKKIKKVVASYGNPKNWSKKIQTDLLKNILPDFSKAFPAYHIKNAALKNLFERVSHNYDKMQNQKDAFSVDGRLNVDYIIKERLQHISLEELSDLQSPYQLAKKHAFTISKYIASTDGEKIDLEKLAQRIWTTQKHLIKGLTPITANNIDTEYGPLDQMIIQCLLEENASEILSQKELTQKVYQSLEVYSNISNLCSRHRLLSIISIILSVSFFKTKTLDTTLFPEDHILLNSFIKRHTGYLLSIKKLCYDTKTQELIQRILALYPIALALPKKMQRKTLDKGVAYLYANLQGDATLPKPKINPTLFVFINAEMHFLQEKVELKTLKKVQDTIYESYTEAVKLPSIALENFDELEIYIWRSLQKRKKVESVFEIQSLIKIKDEIENIVIDNPLISFKSAIAKAMQTFHKIENLKLSKTPSKQEQLIRNHRINTWCSQSDLICKFLHFDKTSSLAKSMLKTWQSLYLDETKVSHKDFVSRVLSTFSKTLPKDLPLSKQLEKRIWISYKLMWYQNLASFEESSYDRCLKWLEISQRDNYPKKSLSAMMEEILPTFPHLNLKP